MANQILVCVGHHVALPKPLEGQASLQPLKLQSVSFASLSPSMFENLELQLCAELSSVRGVVLRHGSSADESNVLRSTGASQ